MILPDVNLLLYAYDAGSRFHERAAAWWAGCLEGEEEIGLAAVAVFGFVRLTTNARVFLEPMSLEEAVGHVESWLERPGVRLIGQSNVSKVFELLKEVGTAGNLVTDAQLAAIAMEEGGVIHTADVDFRRFKGVKVVYPLVDGKKGRRD